MHHKITVKELARKNERSVTQGVTMWVNSLPLGYIFCRDLHQPVFFSLSLWFYVFINAEDNLAVKYAASRTTEEHGEHGSTPSGVKSSKHTR